MNFKTGLYLTITACAAACGLVIEIVAGRMIAPYVGMSLYTWTAIIAVVLAGFSVGHWIGGRLAEQTPDRTQRGVAWSLLLAGLSSAASLLLIRLLSGPIIGLGAGPVVTILLLTTVLFFLPSMFVGIPSPALTKLAIDENAGRLGRVLGLFYAAGATGSIAGTLAAGFIFISWLGTIGTVLGVAVAYVAMSAAMFGLGWRGDAARFPLAPVLVVAIAAGAILTGGSRLQSFRSPCNVESDYYCIRIVGLAGAAESPARGMVLDHLEHGINIRDSPGRFLTPYVEAQDALARIHTGRTSPFRAFFIGGGAYTLPRAWLAARRDAEIHVAEVDPAVTRVAHDQLWLPRSKRLKVVHGDARHALAAQRRGFFNVIVGDAFHDLSVPQHLVTQEFFSTVQEHLAPNGIYLMNVVDHLERPRLALSIMESLKPSFPVVEMWRSNQTGARATFVIAGLRQATPHARLSSRVISGMAFVRVAGADLQELTRTLDPFALTDDYAPVDRLIAVQ